MAKQFLYRANISPIGQQMGGKTVAQGMRRHPHRKIRRTRRLANGILKTGILKMVPSKNSTAGIQRQLP